MKRRASTGEVTELGISRFLRLPPQETVVPQDPCPFFNAFGTCKNGEKCLRSHFPIKESNVILFPQLYPSGRSLHLLLFSHSVVLGDNSEEFFEDLTSYGKITFLKVKKTKIKKSRKKKKKNQEKNEGKSSEFFRFLPF